MIGALNDPVIMIPFPFHKQAYFTVLPQIS